jgi:hypothetical protein
MAHIKHEISNGVFSRIKLLLSAVTLRRVAAFCLRCFALL